MRSRWLGLITASLALLPLVGGAETIIQDSATATNLGLYGGQTRDVASDPASANLYVTMYSPNGFFRSDDDGATWHGLDAAIYDLGEPRGVELDEDGNVYLLITDGLFKSTDHGITLTEIGADEVGQNGNNFIYHEGTLLVGGNDGTVMVSTDQGDSFTVSDVIQADSYVLSLAASPTTDTFYAVLDDTNNGTLYMTSDRGETWTEVTTDDIANRYTTIGVNPNDPDHLIMLSYDEETEPWQSFDHGATWNQFDAYGTPVYINFDAAGRIYVGASYSDDNGASWNTVTTETPANRVSNVWPDSADDDRLYGSTFGAVAMSSDQGASWTDSNQGITAVTVHDVGQSADKTTVWIATGAGLAHTTNFTDASPTWEFPIHYEYYPSAVWVSPTDSNLVVVGGYEALYRTTDGGETWETIDDWNSAYAVKQIASDPNDPTVLYAAGGVQSLNEALVGDVMMSTDSGATWTSLAIDDAAASQTLAVAADGTLYVGAGALDINGETATGIYKYDGSSWTHLADSPDEQMTSLAVDPDDANILYATAADFSSNQHSDGGVYKSTDGGTTWTELSAVEDNGLGKASKYRVITMQGSTRTLYMAGTNTDTNAGTVWKSTDGGNTWGVYYTGLENETFNSLLFDGLVAGNTRGAYDIKGKVAFSTKKSSHKLTVTLTDAATAKKLTHKKVTLWKKVHGDWRKVDADRTNSKGKAIFQTNVKKTTRYKLKYVPIGNAAEEYTTSTSNVVTVKVQ
ncbi:MAG: hypothetical protein HY565_04135 [Candidatus Kerfeldbacteria bacterium]|nr:hypothetical protein [Candidatus Kerfeldbacteria bacterium]